jgi:hypothetical protein
LPIGCVDVNTGSNEACDYITTGQCEATTDVTTIVTFWGLLVGVIIVACIFEIGALYWYTLPSSPADMSLCVLLLILRPFDKETDSPEQVFDQKLGARRGRTRHAPGLSSSLYLCLCVSETLSGALSLRTRSTPTGHL